MSKDRIVKHKLFVVDIEKEQAFLDNYREKGYKLMNIGLYTNDYIFEKCDDEFIPHVRIDYRTFKKKEDYKEYITLYEDAGWKHLKGTYSSGVQYFEQIDVNTTEELFSDKQSYADLYKRLFLYSIINLVCWTCIFAFTLKAYDLRLLMKPKELFLTPGLWDSSGIRFVIGFIFELPFVIWRNGWPFLAFICLMAFIISAIKAKIKENRYIQKI